MNTGEKIAFPLRMVGIICVLNALVYAGNPSNTNPRSPASIDSRMSNSEKSGDGAPIAVDYVSNEIIVKFKQEAANNIEKDLRNGRPLEEISLGDSLDMLTRRFHIQRIEPVFKDFRRQLSRLDVLTRKDILRLNKRELRLLQRMRRSTKIAGIPELDRIYKLEVGVSDHEVLKQILKACRRDPQVEYAELNHIVT
ncbi:MAG: hypothetical protein ACYS8Z_25115, partial [Planctomycetota bacterium]